MPDPRTLEIGDFVRFIALPEEWKQPGYQIHRDSVAFMKRMIRRTWPTRVVMHDQFGYPMICARMRQRGKLHYHSWLITEATGWRLVKRRGKQKSRAVRP